MRTIIIEVMDSNDFTVKEADRYCDKLVWDEMLGTVAELTHPKIGTCSYRMLTEEEWQAHQRARSVPPDFTEIPTTEK